MKTFIQLIAAGIIGGMIAFAGFKMFDKDTVIYEQTARPVSHNVSRTANVDFSQDFVTAAERANPAVVHIKAENKEYTAYSQGNRQQQQNPWGNFWGYRRHQGERPQAGTGSGVIISNDGTIVTNNHVVGFADFITVTMQDGREFKATKVGTDPSTDIAVIKIEGTDLPFLKFSDSQKVKVGEWVVAVGNPFNLTSTVTAGIVSAQGRDLNIIQGQKTIEEFIQTDAVVNPGNSGGALVNTKGDLIGINTAISSPTGSYAGYSFAIPSNLVKRVISEIMEVGGDVQRAMLGVMISDVTPEIKNELKQYGLDIKPDNGVVVTEFPKRTFSSAEYSGIEIGDVITMVENQPINDLEDLRESIKFAKVGDTINVEVDRKGKKKTIAIKLRRGI